MAYGEEKAVRDAKEAGANGYLPPVEALKFRGICTSEGLDHSLLNDSRR
jgi:tryptophan synthase